MNRIDRLAAILIQLQSRPLVKAKDIAEKFSISLRTVYRDVKALEEAGVPVIGEAGTGYRLMEGYKLPPVMFNMDEATGVTYLHLNWCNQKLMQAFLSIILLRWIK
jgi:predicted DNA-binding transcriptional regulator YafY